MKAELADNVFRAGVGAVIFNTTGLVLACERSDSPGSWQLPQGGLKEGEETLAAVLREIAEETAITAHDLTLLGRYPEWLVYELEPERRSGKHGRGQVQQWFYFRLAAAVTVAVENAVSGEFSAARWMELDELAQTTIPFRRPLYARLAAYRP